MSRGLKINDDDIAHACWGWVWLKDAIMMMFTKNDTKQGERSTLSVHRVRLVVYMPLLDYTP